MSMMMSLIAQQRRRRNAGGFDALYLFNASVADSITSTGGSPNLLNTWDSTAGANDLGVSLLQATTADKPRWDGTKVTFFDTSDHLDFDTPVTTAGWVVVGTSLGTFSYKTNTTAWNDLRLFGRSGHITTGDLYGIILLDESATAQNITDAKAFLVGLGASDGVSATSMTNWFRSRDDIIEFGEFDCSGVTSLQFTWQQTALQSFPYIDTSSVTSLSNTWIGSPLETFPALDFSSVVDCFLTWQNTNITSFPLVNMNQARRFASAWRYCSNLENFPSGFFNSWSPSTRNNGCFSNTWDGCTSLTATSVENILNSIDTSGQVAPASSVDITISYNVASGSPNISTAVANLKSRGWTITLNGVAQ